MKSHYVTMLVTALLATFARGDDKPPQKDKSVTNSIGMKLTLIESGSFLMGSPASDSDALYAKPQHRVRISRDFYLGATEVTQGQWEALMGTSPWKGAVKEGSNYPATKVSWDDAVAFCKRLGEKEGVLQ